MKYFYLVFALIFLYSTVFSAVPDDIRNSYQELLVVKSNLVNEEYEKLIVFVDEKYPIIENSFKKYENLKDHLKYLKMFKKYLTKNENKALRYLNIFLLKVKKEYPDLAK